MTEGPAITLRPATKKLAEVPAETRIDWLRDMMVIREFEIRTMQAYQEARIGGFCHIYIGQEALAVGCVAAMKPEDPLVTAYRDHGHGLARGMEPQYGMAEMFGKIGGCAKGKGGSMHFFDRRNQMYGGHGIVGGQTALGAGLAFACKYENEVMNEGEKRVAVCFLGDGALNQGTLHESMNLCAVLGLPCVYVVENNRYSMGTAIERGTSMAHDLTAKAKAYGMEGYCIPGMDVLEVYSNMKKIIDRCREEQRPEFVDIQTYRYKGHSMSDPQKYRTKDEVGEFEAQDPIDRLAGALIEEGSLSEDDYKSMRQDIRYEIREAIEWAEESPDPDPSEDLYSDVLIEPYGPYRDTTLPEMLQDRD
ncbi:MAG: pyruvate dehydrogenase (acetyl-transferring) E1 component subunit alpha [Planctomycetota bacterium]